MKKLLKYLKPYTGQIIFIVLLIFVQTIANLYLPNLNADIINNGVAKGDTGYILRTGGLMLGVSVLLAVCAVTAVYWGSRTAMKFGRDLRRGMFTKVESFTQADIDRFGTPSLITRNTNDIQQVQMLVLMCLNIMIAAPIMCVGGIIMALQQDLQLSSTIAVIVPVLVLIVGIILWRALPYFKIMQKKIDRVNLVMREKLSGIRVIRAFIRNDYEEKRFDEANRDLTKTALTIGRIIASVMPLLMLVLNLSTVAIMWFGGLRVSSDVNPMPIGNLTAFIQYIMQILMSVMMAVMMFVMIPRAMASAERINEVMDTEPSIKDPEHPVEIGNIHGKLEFRNVTFAYGGAEEPVLTDISFTAFPGETTAIIGSTGSGKSTLIHLIPRFYEVTDGAILVDDVDIRSLRQDDLRERVGLIPQKVFLFSGTIASNLRLGRENATEEELWHALEVAQGKDFVMDSPEGLETEISQGGTNVSGGQKQRIAIARALVKRPEIYVFDDSFSALDFKTDAKLRAALKDETKESTVLIVAQRVSTIMNADRIIVLESGRVAGIGKHKELMQTCEVYREIVSSQLSEEELA